MTQNEIKINELCSKATADISLCRVAFTVIDKAPIEEKATLLEAFVVGYRNTPSNHSMELPSFMEEIELSAMLKKYGHLVDKHMMELQSMMLPEKDFYRKLWEYISATPALPTFEARVVGLFNCVIDKRLPYYAVDRSAVLLMEQEDFEAHLAAIGEKNLGRMEFILNSDFDQKTEQASLIVSMMDSLKSFEERTVFIARVIAHFKVELHRMKLLEFARILESRRGLHVPDGFDEDVFSGLDLASLFVDDAEDASNEDPNEVIF